MSLPPWHPALLDLREQCAAIGACLCIYVRDNGDHDVEEEEIEIAG